jgi:hypothetical protein
MRRYILAIALAACGSSEQSVRPDASNMLDIDAAAAPDTQQGPVGFGDLSGMCGVLDTEVTDTAPSLVRATLTFARRFDDPADRPLLTPGGQTLIATPNAGGSSWYSEVFAYEEIARCEMASLLKTETQITYDVTGKITDMLITLDGEKIGVSVTRAQTYPLGTPYQLSAAQTLLTKKLEDIKTSSANVSAADRWRKQVLAVLAWDAAAADVMEQAWTGLDASVKADTIVVLTTTDGDDTFIYTNM